MSSQSDVLILYKNLFKSLLRGGITAESLFAKPVEILTQNIQKGVEKPLQVFHFRKFSHLAEVPVHAEMNETTLFYIL